MMVMMVMMVMKVVKVLKISAMIVGITILSAGFPAQSQVTFILESIPDYTPDAGPIYMAGDFNGWNPAGDGQSLRKNPSGKWWITLPAKPSGTSISYKFTRGSWATVEKGTAGEEIANRSYTFSVTDTILITIHNWADNGGTGTTAAKNVSRLSENFLIPQLNRTRRVWLYLPPDYDSSGKSYPVLYLHDGQNVFDSYTSFAGEWNVDESLNEIAAQGHEVPIVVAVDNGGNYRISEYSPWTNPDYGGGEGDKYVDFIVNTLKPFVDSAYRTRKDRESTGIMGSSMGGLISMYAAMKRPDVFGKAGIFSPSYWFSDDIWPFVRTTGKMHPMRLYQLIGTGEGASTVRNVLSMQDTLRNYGFSSNELTTKVVEGGQHNEQFWSSEFKEAFLWLFPGTSGIDLPLSKVSVKLFPNPAQNWLFLDIPPSFPAVHLKICSITGAVITDLDHFSGNRIDTGGLPAGKYLVSLISGGKVWSAWFIKQ
jgi:predicted alpha/beta superfamily hydrolase